MGSTTNKDTFMPSRPNQQSCPNGFRSTNEKRSRCKATAIIQGLCGLPRAPGQFQGNGHWVVTGGTGRFSAAAGQGSYEGFVDFSASTFNISFTGDISY